MGTPSIELPPWNSTSSRVAISRLATSRESTGPYLPTPHSCCVCVCVQPDLTSTLLDDRGSPDGVTLIVAYRKKPISAEGTANHFNQTAQRLVMGHHLGATPLGFGDNARLMAPKGATREARNGHVSVRCLNPHRDSRRTSRHDGTILPVAQPQPGWGNPETTQMVQCSGGGASAQRDLNGHKCTRV